MTGTVNISRGIFSSEAFRDEPLTEREAWMWMVMAASWKDRTVRAGDYVTDTKRGQFAHSIRYMAKAWKWTPAKAQRYVKRLEKLKMICVETDTGVSVVTICKYDEYQSARQATDTGPIQDRYRTDTEKNKDERREEGKREERLPFSAFWSVWPNKTAKAAAVKAWGKLSQADRVQASTCADEWFQRWRQGNPQASPIHPASYLNQKRWTDHPPQFLPTTGRRNERLDRTDPRFDPALEQISRLA